MYAADYAIFYSLSEWQTNTGFDVNSLPGAPFIENISNKEFKLMSNSALKGKGRFGEDIGAYPTGNVGGITTRPKLPTKLVVE